MHAAVAGAMTAGKNTFLEKPQKSAFEGF